MSNTKAPERPATSTPFQLFDYQEKASAAIDQSISEGDYRPLVALATGGGKTIIFANQIKELSRPSLVLAHSDELISQAIAKLRMVCPEADIGRVQGPHNETGHQVTVASVQTLNRPNRFYQAFQNQTALDRVGLVVTDEAHHAAAPSYQTIYDRFGLLDHNTGGRIHLGVTATPARADNQGLDNTFDRVAFSWTIRDGIREGRLCNLKGYTLLFDNEDFSEVRTRAGEYITSQLERATRKVARDQAIVNAWLEQACLENGSYRRTILFAVSIEHAHELAEAFDKAGVRVGVVHGQMPLEERQATLLKFHRGELDLISNCQVLTEGFDCPPVSCVVMARPCRSTSLYIQMVGRGTRLSPGKPDCLILDVSDVARYQSVDTAVTLGEALGFSKSYKVFDAAEEIWEAEKENNPLAFVRRSVTGGSDFDPLADPLGTEAGVKFRWTTGASGLTLSLPKDPKTNLGQWLVVYCRPDLLYDIYKIRGYTGHPERKQRVINEFGLPDSTAAVRIAEHYALKTFPDFGRMAGRSASWRDRTEPASDKQLDLLRKLYRGRKISPYMNGTPTKAQAALMIDAAIASTVSVEQPRSDDTERRAA